MTINKENGVGADNIRPKEKEYKVTYVFDKDSKANINEILKQSFIFNLKDCKFEKF